MLLATSAAWASTERQPLLASHPGEFMFQLVGDTHLSDIGSLYWENYSDMLPAASWEWASMECEQLSALHLGYFMFRLVADIHLPDTGSLHWGKLQRHAPGRIWKMNVNGASTIVSFASWVIYVPIGWRHPFIRYWQPLLGKTTATCSLPHRENEGQWSVNYCQLCILGNLCSDWLETSIYQLLAAITGKNNSDMVPAASWKWAWTERQHLKLFHIW